MHDLYSPVRDRAAEAALDARQVSDFGGDSPAPPSHGRGLRYAAVPVPDIHVFVLTSNTGLLEVILQALGNFGAAVTILENAFEAQRSETLTSGLLIIDTDLPGGGGLSEWRRLTSASSALTAIFVSARPDVSLAVQCMKDGAENFFAEPICPGELKAGLQAALMAQATREEQSVRNEARQNIIKRLTPAERIVANLMAEGLFTKQIAAKIGRSENTVKIHRARILRKAGVPSAACFARLLSGELGDVLHDAGH